MEEEERIGLPLISIIIPCYNSENYIGECIDSILSQDYENIEVIAINDGSTDSSLDILNSYDNIKIYSQINSGACVARNNGLEKSNGKYIKFLDSDDFLEPNVIAEQIILAESLDNNMIVFGDYFLLRGEQKLYEDNYIDEVNQTSSLILGDILTSTPLHRKWMLEKVQGFDERFKNGQEWNLHIRLSSEGFVFHHQQIPIFSYRIHNSSSRISITKTKDKERILYEALKIKMTEDRLSNNSLGNVSAAIALKYWGIAKSLYRNGDRKEYKIYLKKSKESTDDFKKLWSLKYSVVYKILGFHVSESIFKIYDLSRKHKRKNNFIP